MQNFRKPTVIEVCGSNPRGCERLVGAAGDPSFALGTVGGMAAKPRTWPMFAGGCRGVMYLVLLVIWLVGLDGLAVNAQNLSEAARFLNQKESNVKAIADKASGNYDNCGGLEGCSDACSRVVCHPIRGESPNCTIVGYNEFYSECPMGACLNKMLVDYTRSFVTLPAPGSTNLSTEVARDICLQRELDSTFKTVSLPSEYSNVYFGSSSGAFRSFPGRERNGTGCNTYDPRKRHWYLNGVSVAKDVKILVDVASSMGKLVSPDYGRLPGTTYLDVAKNITLELLHSFSKQDFVEVFSFDSSSATSSTGAVLISSPYDYLDPASQLAELASLEASVGDLTVSTKAAPSNLTRAIVEVVNSFNTFYGLKVIVVLSDGHFDPLNTTAFPSLLLQNGTHIKLMVYKLPKSDDGEDPYLLNDPSLRENICSVNGSFERLNALETVNPLYSMRRYFTFLARTMLATLDDNAVWSFQYDSNSSRWTVTYPAFGKDGLLIGVAGLDVDIYYLNESLREMVLDELLRRYYGTPTPRIIPMVCLYQSTPASSVCSGSTPANSSAICPGINDPASTLASRTCCGFGTCDSPGAALPRARTLYYIIALGAVLMLIAISAYCYFRKTEVPLLTVADLLHFDLCEHYVRKIEGSVKSGGSTSKRNSTQNLLNQRQCLDLSVKLSATVKNIKEIVLQDIASYDLFKPALGKLYLVLETAELLVRQCGEKDWWTASVFQSQNEIDFQEILLDVALCYNVIYEQARSISAERDLPEDLRQSLVFMPAPQNAIREDQVDLRTRLEAVLGNEHKVSLKQSLVKYLLVKLNDTFELSGANNLDTCNSILWSKEAELQGTWGSEIRFLGSGTGATGVCSIKWMGIPCAKKEFHLKESEQLFLKEASIFAHLKHPCIVNFICCGNGEQKGDRFIAMELMQKSLHDLIEDQRSEYFPLSVVIDIMVQIARGMCYIHGQGIAHRDLKPLNVVVNDLRSPHLENHFSVKLVDFGMSKIKVQASQSETMSCPGVGTTLYRAPEVFRQAHPEGAQKAVWFKADVFSFAMTCAHLLSLKRPFEDPVLSELYQNLMDGRRPELPSDCPEELCALLRDCWETSPSSRPTFTEICTRLEVLRYKLFGPTLDSSLQQTEAIEFIKRKIGEHSRSFSQRPIIDAINNVEVKDAIRQDSLTGKKNAPETSMEMVHRSSRERAKFSV